MKEMLKDFNRQTAKQKLICIILFVILACGMCFGQAKVTRNGNNFAVEKTATGAKGGSAIETKFTYTDTDGKQYTIMLSKNGRAYIVRTSKNGNEYKKYLGEEISRTICSELGVEYKETTK